MARAPFFSPGWVVTSLTRSPASQTSRSCSRNPLRYCRPVRAGIAPRSLAPAVLGESMVCPGERPAPRILNGRPLFSLLFTGNYQRRADRRPQESLVLVEDEREKTAYDDLILLKYH